MAILSTSRPNRARRKIAFVTFETELAPCGGLAAVMRMLPRKLAERESCFTIGPYFPNITASKPVSSLISDTGIAFPLQFGGERHLTRVLKYVDSAGYVTWLLEADGFFTAPKDPYVNPGDSEKLLLDSLFFCAAVPMAVRALGEAGDLVLHLQDWESACVAHTIRHEPEHGSTACILTLHNPYDKGLSDSNASLISAYDLPGQTVLMKMIPLIDGALTTVSRNFASELVSDPLHTEVFADHLQSLFRTKGIVGVDNGLFGEHEFPFSGAARQQADRGDFGPIRKEKWLRRIELSETLEAYLRDIESDPERRVWGDRLDLADPHLPVFLFLGRDDPRQKGYDVAAAAIRKVPQGKARYIFTPMPGDEGFEGLSFLRTLAGERPGEVMVFPFRLAPEPFIALQRGSSYMAMFSLYEPFGGANEAYLAGMPVVARATGGLVQQVAPHGSSWLGGHGRRLVREYHAQDAEPTGFLFREPASEHHVIGWRRIVACPYLQREPMGDRVEDRSGTGLFDEMVDGAFRSLQAAIDLYSLDQNGYAKMIYSGFRMLDNFSWETALDQYQKLYDEVCGNPVNLPRENGVPPSRE